MYFPVRKSPRWKDYDYGSEWCYFVTIVTKDREQYFGKIVDGEMVLNEIGIICKQEIIQTQTIRLNVEIHEFVVMPNHIHVIIIICNTTVGTCGNTSATWLWSLLWSDALQCVPTQSLWSIVRNIKSRVTKYANIHNISFARQSRYHDHIIRNSTEYDRIKYYIQANPEHWKKDTFTKNT